MARNYKELRIWQQAIDLVSEVYKLAALLPKEEKYGLNSQIKRSAVSVPSNIAEGESRGDKEFSHFLRIAIGSLAELETQLIITTRLNMISQEKVDAILISITSLTRQIKALRQKLI